ncbi:MAG TPA: hypothetical protein P5230_02605 [Candidatus Magasanikbacteria bacterium]|nr:hypothetical protein [Candidatus Magasanikbacteria bacterium]
MFKKIFLTFLFGILLLGNTSFCLAQNTDAANEIDKQLQAAAGEKGAGFDEPVDPRDGIFLIIRYALGMLGFVFLLLALYAGFLWMTAGGDEGNIEKAKSILTAAVIGLIIILLSYSITLFVFKVVLLEGAPFRRWE